MPTSPPQIATPEARDKLAATIADLVVPRNYDGINIDFEDIRPKDRPLLTDTMSRIAAINRHFCKLVTQAIVGKAFGMVGWLRRGVRLRRPRAVGGPPR